MPCVARAFSTLSSENFEQNCQMSYFSARSYCIIYANKHKRTIISRATILAHLERHTERQLSIFQHTYITRNSISGNNGSGRLFKFSLLHWDRCVQRLTSSIFKVQSWLSKVHNSWPRWLLILPGIVQSTFWLKLSCNH